MSTKFATLRILLTAAVLAALTLAGCGGGSSVGNVVVVSISPKGTTTAPLTVIVTQSLTLTANVTGSTNTNVTWSCTYATSTFDSTGKQTTGTATPCSADSGNIPANSTNTTVIFTAPQKIPDPTKITGSNCTSGTQQTCILAVTITATSAADTKKTDTSVIQVGDRRPWPYIAWEPFTGMELKKEGERIAVGLSCKEGSPLAEGSHLLLAVGRHPNTQDLGLEEAGVDAGPARPASGPDRRATGAPHRRYGQIMRWAHEAGQALACLPRCTLGVR